jgi:CHAD domain-containing protein
VRDLDVILEHLLEEVASLPPADRAGAELLLERLRVERVAARGRLLEVLDGDTYRRLLAQLRVPPRLADGVETIRLDRIARKELARLARAVERAGPRPDDGAVHSLRILLKRVRYATELAAPEGKGRRRFLAEAKVLQDLLGEHQDAVVTEERLRASAVTDATTAAAFVAGRLAERQRARRAAVQERLPSAWKRLHRSGGSLG